MLREEELADAEDPEAYLAGNVFRVPGEAQWSRLQAVAKRTTVGNTSTKQHTIKTGNAWLRGVLPEDTAHPALHRAMPGELIDLVSCIVMAEAADRSRDILGRVHE